MEPQRSHSRRRAQADPKELEAGLSQEHPFALRLSATADLGEVALNHEGRYEPQEMADGLADLSTIPTQQDEAAGTTPSPLVEKKSMRSRLFGWPRRYGAQPTPDSKQDDVKQGHEKASTDYEEQDNRPAKPSDYTTEALDLMRTFTSYKPPQYSRTKFVKLCLSPSGVLTLTLLGLNRERRQTTILILLSTTNLVCLVCFSAPSSASFSTTTTNYQTSLPANPIETSRQLFGNLE